MKPEKVEALYPALRAATPEPRSELEFSSPFELLVAVGSHPNARRFVFHGDIKPLSDIKLLFEYSVGEKGMERLPPQLAYLRDDS